MDRKTYNDEFKIAAAKLVTEQGYSARKAALSLGADQASIRIWVRKFAPASQAPATDASTEDLRREVQRLRDENRRLIMGREILKKAAAFFAKELP
jgi:transposase